MSPPATLIPHALFLLVPLFPLAIAVPVLHNTRPHKSPSAALSRWPHARRAYIFIALLTLLSTLAGALPLAQTTPPVAIAVVQALLSFFLGLPALHLASTPPYAPPTINSVLQLTYTAVLVISLLGATLTALVLPSSSDSSPLYLPPVLFLLYSCLALIRIASTLFYFLRPPFPQRRASARSSASSSSSGFFFNFNRHRTSTARNIRPITIHIETQRTSIPLSLSSPASSAVSLPFSPDRDNKGDLQPQHRIGEEELPIELDLALPTKRSKPTRSRPNHTVDVGRYLYQNQDQDEKKGETEKPPHPHHLQPKGNHEKSSSVDSSTASTLTGVDHKRRSLSPASAPVPLAIVLTSPSPPPRAIHHHHHSPNSNNYTSPPTATNCIFEPPPFSSAHQEEALFDVASASSVGRNSIVDFRSGDRRGDAVGRSRTLFVLLFAAQLILVVGYACAIGESTRAGLGSSSHLTTATATTLVSLKIVQSVTTVLAITGTMSAYLLHAYNTHLSPSRSRRSRASGVAPTANTSAIAIDPPPPPPPPSAYRSHNTTTNAFSYNNNTHTNMKSASESMLFSPDVHCLSSSSSVPNPYESRLHSQYEYPDHQRKHQRDRTSHVNTSTNVSDNANHNNTPATKVEALSAVSMHYQSHIQIAEVNSRRRPVVIQLEAPPPPRTRRRRAEEAEAAVDVSAGRESGGAGAGERGGERKMDVPRSVSISRSVLSDAYAHSDPHQYYHQEAEAEAEMDYDSGYYGHEHNSQDHSQEVQYQEVSASVDSFTGYNVNAYSHGHQRRNHHHHRQQQQQQHQYYDPPHHHPQNNNMYGRPHPITLTYEPPVISGGMSLLEATETEGDDHHDLDFQDDDNDDDYEDDYEDEGEQHEDAGERGGMERNANMNSGMDMGMNMDDMDSELDLEGEMQRALSLSLTSSSSLSRSSSMASSMMSSSGGPGSGTGASAKQQRANGFNHTESHDTKPTLNKLKPKPKPRSSQPPKTRPKAKKPAEDPATYIRKRGSMPAAPRTRKWFGWEFGWESGGGHHAGTAGNSKRVSVVGAAAAAKKKKEAKRSSKPVMKEEWQWEQEEREREALEASFMDLKGGALIGGGAATTMPTRKLKRHSTPAGSLYRSLVGGGGNDHGKEREKEKENEKQEKWEETFGGKLVGGGPLPVLSAAQANVISMNLESKKLKKMRSESGSLRPSASKGSGALSSSRGFVTAASSSSGGSTLNGNTRSDRKLSRSGSSTSTPGSGDSSKTGHGGRASLNNGRGLQLKRSFKLSVGRTLGPGLTLASASMVGNGKEEEGVRNEGYDDNEGDDRGRRMSDDRPSSMGDGDEEDVDVDGEIRSISAARLVSASIARVTTAAATIVTAPLTTGTSLISSPPHSSDLNRSHSSQSHPTVSSNGPQRPVLHAIVTSAPIPIPTANGVPFPMSAPASRRPPTGLSPTALSPTSTRQPPHTSGSNWKPHPFADLLDPSPTTMLSYDAPTASSDEGVKSVEDDVVLLEREIMEAIRGRRGGDGSDNNLMESPTIQFRELEVAMGVQGISVSGSPITPLLSSSMTPSLNSMFAHAHAQAQTVGPVTSDPPLPAATATTTTTTTAIDSSATTTGASEKPKNKIFGVGGQPQKRLALSSPPASKSDWGPQSSAGSTTGGGFPYRFPMIFPHSFTGSPPRPGVQANGQGGATPRPGTPRGGGAGGGGSTLRLSAMTMSTVRNTFAGIGARMSSATSRMSVNSTVSGFKAGNGNAFGEMVMDDTYGDFMDLRDPFASPPPTSTVAIVPPLPSVAASQRKKKSRSKVGVILGNEVLDAIDSGYGAGMGQVHDATRKKINAWGKLPVPVRSFSPVPSAGSGNAPSGSKRHSFIISGRIVGKPSSAASHSRKHHHKKERRTRKTTLPSMAGALAASKPGAEDADFGLEEALLSQRLLNRLVSDGWEGRV